MDCGKMQIEELLKEVSIISEKYDLIYQKTGDGCSYKI
jgi:hypothetical protein